MEGENHDEISSYFENDYSIICKDGNVINLDSDQFLQFRQLNQYN
jgi:hypothetical protein